MSLTGAVGAEQANRCQRCRARPRWSGGSWCAPCVVESCCEPKALRGDVCQHGDRAIDAAARLDEAGG